MSFLFLCSLFFSYFIDTERLAQKEKNELIIILCTELFKDILSHFVNPANLGLEIESQTSKRIPELISVSDRQSDLNFFCGLLRDTCNISPHKNGWGNPPDSKDNCVAACIDRIKFKSDEIWSRKGGFSSLKFPNILRNLRNDILEIERQVLDGQLYERRIEDLLSKDVSVMDSISKSLLNTELGMDMSNNQYF